LKSLKTSRTNLNKVFEAGGFEQTNRHDTYVWFHAEMVISDTTLQLRPIGWITKITVSSPQLREFEQKRRRCCLGKPRHDARNCSTN
jgi:hypothetical protein